MKIKRLTALALALLMVLSLMPESFAATSDGVINPPNPTPGTVYVVRDPTPKPKPAPTAHTHTFGDWTVTKQATSSSYGIRTRVCKVCGYKQNSKYYVSGTLRPGIKSPTEVKVIQQELVEIGYDRVKVTGEYDDATESAVSNHQKQAGEEQSGIAYPDTQTSINWRWQEKQKITKESGTVTRGKIKIPIQSMYTPWVSNGDGTHSRYKLSWKKNGKSVKQTEDCVLTPTEAHPDGECPKCGYAPEVPLKLLSATLTHHPEGVYNNFEQRIGGGTVELDCTYNGVSLREAQGEFAESLVCTMTLYWDGEAILTTSDAFEQYLFRDGVEFPGPGEYYAVVTVTDGSNTETVTSNTVTIQDEYDDVPYIPTDPVDNEEDPGAEVTIEIQNHSTMWSQIHVGDWITFSVTVTNTGTVPLVFMDFDGIESEVEMNFSEALDVGQSETVYGYHEVTEEDLEFGHYTDPEEGFLTDERQEMSSLWLTGTIHYIYVGLDSRNEFTVWDATDSATLYARLSDDRNMRNDLTLQCEYEDRAYRVGEEIALHWTLTNVGPVTLQKLADDSNNQAVPSLPDTLAPGESYSWTQLWTPTQEDYDLGLEIDWTEDGYVYGEDADGKAYGLLGNIITYIDPDRPAGDNEASSDYFVILELLPAETSSVAPLWLDITSDYDGAAYHPNEILTVTYSLTNTTPYALTTDQVEGFTVDLSAGMAPGETRTWTEEYPITQGMIEEGHYLDPEDGAVTEEYQDTCVAVRGNFIRFAAQDPDLGPLKVLVECVLIINLEDTKGAPAQAPAGEQGPKIMPKSGVPAPGYDLSKGGLELIVQVAPEDAKPFYEVGETVHLKIYTKNTGSAMLYRLRVYGGDYGGSSSMVEAIAPKDMLEWKNETIHVKDNFSGSCRITYVAMALMTPEYTFSEIQNIPDDAPWIGSETAILYFPIAQAKDKPAKESLVDAESLKLIVTQTSEEKSVYEPGDTLTFTAAVKNQSDVDVQEGRITCVTTDALVDTVKDLGTLKAGQQSMPYSFHYTVTKEDAAQATITLSWDASAVLPEGVRAKPNADEHAPEFVTYDYVVAKRETLTFQAATQAGPAIDEKPQEAPAAAIQAGGKVDAASEKTAYPEGDDIGIVLSAQNTGDVALNPVYMYLDGVLSFGAGPLAAGKEATSEGHSAFWHQVHDSGDGFDHVAIKVEGTYDNNGEEQTVTNEITLDLPVEKPAAPAAPSEKEVRIAALGEVNESTQKSEYTEGEWILVDFYALNSGEETLDTVYTSLNGVFASSGGPVEPSHIFGNGVDHKNTYSHQIHDAGDGFDRVTIRVIGEHLDIMGTPTTVSDEVTLVLKVQPAAPTIDYPDPDPITVTHEPGEEPDPTEIKEPELKLVVTKLTAEPLHFDGLGNTPEVQYMLTISNVGEADCTVYSVSVTLPDGSDSIDLGGATLEPGGEPINKPYGHVYKETDVDVLDGMIHATFQARGEAMAKPYDSDHQSLAHTVTKETEGWSIPDATAVRIVKNETSTPKNGAYRLGEKITYSVSVTNVSDVTIPSLAIQDPLIGPGDLSTLIDLKPMETRTVTEGYYYIVAQPDVDNGQVYNMAKAVWTDPVSGNLKSEPSNPVTVYTAEENEVSVDVEYLDAPSNGLYYRLNDLINIKVSWKNNTDETLYGVDVHDYEADWIGAAPGGYVLKDGTLAPGQEDSFTYLYIVDSFDVGMKSVDDTASIGGSNAAGELFTDVDFESKPADEDKKTVGLSVSKTETSKPANGEYYTEGETITYEITFVNDGEETLTDVRLFDTLNESVTFSGFSSVTTFYPTDSRTYKYSHTVTKDDVDAGQVRNSAMVLYSSLYQTDVPAYSNTVVSYTGEEKKQTTGGIHLDGDVDSCVLTLTGLGNGAAEFTLEPCDRHGDLIRRMESNTMKDNSDPAFALSGWTTVKRMWLTELDELYQQLLDAAQGDARAAVMGERASFCSYVEACEALLKAQQPSRPDLAAKAAADLVMRRVEELCYVIHNAPAQRPDSRIDRTVDSLALSDTPEECVRQVEKKDGVWIYTDILCDSHKEADAIVDNMLDRIAASAEIADVFVKAQRLYQAGLDSYTTALYRSADQELRPLVAQRRIAFDALMRQRKALLEYLYPDDPEIVSEVLSQDWRSALIEHCAP